MKQVRIITFHRAENFGAAFQVFALQEKVKELGFDAVILDYRPNSIEKVYRLIPFFELFRRKNFIVSFKRIFLSLFTIRIRYSKKLKYRLFRDHYLTISKQNYLDDMQNADILIAGSDQIWNTKIISGFDPVYFLSNNSNAKKIVYAASSELYDYNNIYNYSDEIIKSLNGIDFISVRENQFRDVFTKISNKNISVVLDPTFFIDTSIYTSIAKIPEESGYILVYHLFYSEKTLEIAEKVRKKTNLDIIEVFALPIPFVKERNLRLDLGPRELLGYIINSNFIITTSFHGTVFSLIFKKQFIVMGETPSIRQRNLLVLLNLEDRIIESNYLPTNSIDYSVVDLELDRLKIKSEEFLMNSLGVN